MVLFSPSWVRWLSAWELRVKNYADELSSLDGYSAEVLQDAPNQCIGGHHLDPNSAILFPRIGLHIVVTRFDKDYPFSLKSDCPGCAYVHLPVRISSSNREINFILETLRRFSSHRELPPWIFDGPSVLTSWEQDQSNEAPANAGAEVTSRKLTVDNIIKLVEFTISKLEKAQALTTDNVDTIEVLESWGLREYIN